MVCQCGSYLSERERQSMHALLRGLESVSDRVRARVDEGEWIVNENGFFCTASMERVDPSIVAEWVVSHERERAALRESVNAWKLAGWILLHEQK